MLSLQSRQVDDLAERRFEKRLAGLLAEQDPASAGDLSSTAGRHALRLQIGRARGHGMAAELDIARYVIAAWLLGPDFDTRFAAVAEILRQSQLTPAQRSAQLEAVTVQVLSDLQDPMAEVR